MRMLPLHYTGPKPTISQHGIYFRDGKEDKYVYLKIAVSSLLSIDKLRNERYHGRTSDPITDAEILEVLKAYEPDLEAHIAEEEKRYEAHIDAMIEDVKAHPLPEEDRQAWISNIAIMRPYMIQREINKLYYIHCLKAIKEIIHRDNIKEIDIEFGLHNWHILESIAGNLEYEVKSVHTAIKVESNREGKLIAKLLINPPKREKLLPSL